MMLLGWGLVAVISLFIWALMRSPWGRVLKSIREDEDAARALGKNVLAYKMQSLILGGLIGSIGGLWLSAQKQSAQTGEFATTLTFFAFTIIVLGGLGRVKGPIVGTIIFFFVIQFVDNMLEQGTRNGKHARWLVDQNNFSVGQEHRRRAGPRRCWWCSAPRASSVTDESRSSMSADRGHGRAGGAGHDGRPRRGQARPDPRRRLRAPRFGGLVAVDVEHVEIERNQITALIGPNGAGKTTFFNLLTGFDEPDSGTWHFDGHEVGGMPPTRSPGWAWSARSS